MKKYADDVQLPDTNAGMPAGRPTLSQIIVADDGSSDATLTYPDGRTYPIHAAPGEQILHNGVVKGHRLIVRGAPGGGTHGITRSEARSLNAVRKEKAAAEARKGLLRAVEQMGLLDEYPHEIRTPVKAWGKVIEHIAVLAASKSSRDSILAAQFIAKAAGLLDDEKSSSADPATRNEAVQLPKDVAMKLLSMVDDAEKRRAAQPTDVIDAA